MLGGNALALILLGLIWTTCFVLFAYLRREQIITSLAASSLFPILHAYAYQDIATTGFQELLFLFLTGGLSSIIFHIIFGQYYLHGPRHFTWTRSPHEVWVWHWLALLFMGAWLMVLFAFAWPTLTAGSLVAITALLFLLYYAVARRDLLFDAIMSALLMTSLFACVHIVLIGTTGTYDAFHFDTYLQAAGLGLFFGPLYEFVRNLKLHHGTARI